MTEEFRVAHISDLHIADSPSSLHVISLITGGITSFSEILTGVGSLARIVGQLSSYDDVAALKLCEFFEDMGDKVDALIVTGDLATTGSEGDLRAANKFLSSGGLNTRLKVAGSNRLNAAAIANSVPFCFYVPGNHDRFQGNRFKPGGKLLDSSATGFFKSNWTLNSGSVTKQLTKNPRFKSVLINKQSESLGVILGDLSLPKTNHFNPLAYLGKGLISEKLATEFQAETLACKKFDTPSGVPCAIAWAIHFPPFWAQATAAKASKVDHLILEGENWLEKYALQSGVRHIFAGHRHESRRYLIGNGDITVHVAKSATAFENRHDLGFYIHNISVSNGEISGVISDNYVYAPLSNLIPNAPTHFAEESALKAFLNQEKARAAVR